MNRSVIVVALLTATNLVADITAGEQVYKANCAICHTINGGSALGPDLNIVAYTRTVDKIEQYTRDPYSLYEEFGYSANAMPTLPLEEQEIKDVADYISSLQPFKKWMIKNKPTKKILVKNSDSNSSDEG